MNSKDIERLRYLAQHQVEIANSPKNLERVELWKRHNACKGGAPVTPEFSQEIGADAYSKDAAQAADVALKFFE